MSRQSNAKPAETGQMVLISATRRLHQAGVKAAGGDARRLLAHALKITPDRLTLVTNETVTSATAARFEVYLQRRILREPVSHILGYREFCSRKFVVTRDVLDPRPETELLVKTALENAVTSILDLGTGSGCVLLSILADMPKARGTGT
ncbi:MAG: N5-glutamine methyltransferase family protein, partial [Paracoccaceae bacterium]